MKIPSSLTSYLKDSFLKDTHLKSNRVNAQYTETEISSAQPSMVVHLSERYKSANDDERLVQNVRDIFAQIGVDPEYADRIVQGHVSFAGYHDRRTPH